MLGRVITVVRSLLGDAEAAQVLTGTATRIYGLASAGPELTVRSG